MMNNNANADLRIYDTYRWGDDGPEVIVCTLSSEDALCQLTDNGVAVDSYMWIPREELRPL